jgi:ethanolamine-phosphate cytidylyltransferase
MTTSPRRLVNRVVLNPDAPTDPYQMYGATAVPPKQPGKVRVWVDGCFDMLHFGHTNAIRQARILGDELFVGCHSDEEIKRYKGPPIMQEEERYEALRACKWVTYVVENYPYVTRLKDIERFEIDFVVHGDDISVGLDGRNSYQENIDAGRFRVVKRTDGISTTDLVGRMLLCTKGHHHPEGNVEILDAEATQAANKIRYLTTGRKIAQFSNNRAPGPKDLVVYVDGSFDLFHIGHMRVLHQAKNLVGGAAAAAIPPGVVSAAGMSDFTGVFVVVGIHEDAVVNQHKGSNYPIMNLNERALGVLSCGYADDVVMGVPFVVTQEIVASLGIHCVVAGRVRDEYAQEPGAVDPYAYPKSAGIFVEVDSQSDLTTESLIHRIVEHRAEFIARQRSKAVKDKASQESKPAEYRNVKEVA